MVLVVVCGNLMDREKKTLIVSGKNVRSLCITKASHLYNKNISAVFIMSSLGKESSPGFKQFLLNVILPTSLLYVNLLMN